LEKLANTVRSGSLCGLGAGAPNPVLTTLKYFRSEYDLHILEKRCPAMVCKDLIRYYIDEQKCHGCGLCKDSCPVGAISGEKKAVHVIDGNACIKCGACLDACPDKFKAVEKGAAQCVY
jgi:ferredoxin